MQHVFASLLVGALLFQAPTLDSTSPKERQAAIDQMAVIGNTTAIPALADAYKKEPRKEIRAEILAALARIRDKGCVAPLADALRTDLDKDVRLQAIDSLLHLYLPVEETPGTVKTIMT